MADFTQISALIQNALMTETDLSGLAEWIDVCNIEGDAYVYLPDGPIETKRVPIHFTYNTNTHQLSYQL